MYTTERQREPDTLQVPSLKPRNKYLNEVLLGRHGGRMKNLKDHSRQKEKQQLRNLSFED